MLGTVPENLFGRDAVLTVVRTALDDALAGTAQLVLVTGEPGIGKTAVLAALAREAAERGAAVARATCWDGGAPAYWPWIQALRAVPADELGTAAELLGPAPGLPAVSSADAADARFRLFDATAGLLTRLSRAAGLVVVLDDLQWADEASLRMLAFLARHLGPARVLLLGAYRELDGGLAIPAQVVPLSGLGANEVADVMTAVAGPRPDGELAARVWRRSGGNPLFVRELTRLMQAGPGAADAVPETVRDILLSRLARLSQPCAELLAAAAVCGGQVVRPELLGRLTGADPDVLEEATAARVLTRSPEGLRFSHDLYRETLLDGLPARRRAALHAQAGHALRELRDAGAAVAASEVAAQFLAAGPELAANAVRYCALAGREAALRTAHDDAAACYRDALAALDLAGGASAGPQRRDLLVGLAEALDHAGDTAAARAAYWDLAELGRRTGDPYGLAGAALGLHGLGFRSGTAGATHLGLLSEAADGLPPDALALRSQLLTALGRDLRGSADHSPERVAAVVREAGALAAEADDALALARVLLAQHDVHWRPGGATERLAILTDLADAAEKARDRDLAAQAVLLRATALIELGAPEGTALLHSYTQLAEGLGHARGRWAALSRRATLITISGKPADALALADEALELGLMIGEPDAFAVHGTLRLSVGLVAPVPAAEPVLELDLADPVAPMLPLLRAATMLAAGATDLARAEFTGFAVSAAPEQYHLEMCALAAAVAAAVGSAEQREQAYSRLVDYAGTHVVVGGCASYSGAVDHHLGMLCAALGRHEEATARLDAAVAQHERLGAPAWTERSRAELAKLRSAGACVFHRNGRVWTLRFQGQEVHLPHTKGLADLARLLAAPGSDVPAIELLGRPVPATGADPLLDQEARRAYRARIAQLDTAIAEAADHAEAQRHQAERTELVRQITAAAGLGGRPRRLGSDTERARKAVTARIRDALDRILQAHPELGLHLRGTIHTGTHCGYHPADEIHWRL
ncbi:ATP-binding protein [Amycolatopsis sp.]|uniref:ATP-binding protein n=1 Tax=Amycolatopsis sp. TaxID=37632 RepID=UPI002CF5BD10|nr:AAA family ATPase [Amycolatopsis sp.]HVV12575.1 AAA family ATPase [Amycolatopsis sp.]